MEISVNPSDDVLRRYANQIGALGERKAHTALARAINRTTTSARTQVVRAIGKQSSIPLKIVRTQVQRKQVKPGGIGVLEGHITATGNGLPIKVFKPKQFTWGVRVKVWGKQQRYSGMFIFAGRFNSGKDVANGHVFQRVTTASLPIEMQYGPAVPSEMVRNEAKKAFERTVQDMLPRRVQHELGRLLPR